MNSILGLIAATLATGLVLAAVLVWLLVPRRDHAEDWPDSEFGDVVEPGTPLRAWELDDCPCTCADCYRLDPAPTLREERIGVPCPACYTARRDGRPWDMHEACRKVSVTR